MLCWGSILIIPLNMPYNGTAKRIGFYVRYCRAYQQGQPYSRSYDIIYGYYEVQTQGAAAGTSAGSQLSLPGHIPICAVCKYVHHAEEWEPVESYLESRLPIEFTHDICPDCIRRLYPKYSSILDDPEIHD